MLPQPPDSPNHTWEQCINAGGDYFEGDKGGFQICERKIKFKKVHRKSETSLWNCIRKQVIL